VRCKINSLFALLESMAGERYIRNIFITGASRGLGLEFVKQFSELPQPPKLIFATCRNPDNATDLKELAAKNTNIQIHKLDVLDYSSYPAIVKWVEEKLVPGEGLNVLINNAAIASWEHGKLPVPREEMLSELETNAVSPLMLTQAFLPLLKKAAEAEGDSEMSCSRAAIINISSRMGSIQENTSGGSYPYRASKAALNMITKSLSLDLKPQGILAVVLHPGWVLTDMGGKNALINTTTSVEGMLKVMQGLNDDSSGAFISFKGEAIPF